MLNALVDPPAALRAGAAEPAPLRAAASLLGTATVLGLATLPRQLAALSHALAPIGDPQADMHNEVLRHGLQRLIVADRLVPSPSLLVAALLLVALAHPVLMLARDRRSALLEVTLLGLTPLLVDRLGELVMTHLLPLGGPVAAGEAVLAPHRFRTGALLLWRSPEPAPAWLELLEPRANLIILWTAVLWSLGLRELEGRGLAPWHVALPLACVLGGGIVSWVLGPLVVSAVLGGG